MLNAWFFYVLPLGVGVLFALAGVVSVRKVLRGDRNVHGCLAGCFSILVTGVGSTLALGILLTSPTPCQRERLFDRVFRTPPERIERFVILPGRSNQYRPLTQWAVVIDDPAVIRRIAEILRTSPDVFPNHPHSRWTAKVEMVTNDGTFYFAVNAPVPGDANGILVTVQRTSEGGGWNLGDFRAEGLAEILEEAVKQNEINSRK